MCFYLFFSLLFRVCKEEGVYIISYWEAEKPSAFKISATASICSAHVPCFAPTV